MRHQYQAFARSSPLFHPQQVSYSFGSEVINFNLVVPNTDPPIVDVVGGFCNGNVAGLPCNWTLTANVRRSRLAKEDTKLLQLDFSGNSPFNATITSFLDDTGDTYLLKSPLKASSIRVR
jgi:hypothetical protein